MGTVLLSSEQNGNSYLTVALVFVVIVAGTF